MLKITKLSKDLVGNVYIYKIILDPAYTYIYGVYIAQYEERNESM